MTYTNRRRIHFPLVREDFLEEANKVPVFVLNPLKPQQNANVTDAIEILLRVQKLHHFFYNFHCSALAKHQKNIHGRDERMQRKKRQNKNKSNQMVHG